jgi:hypothetical protein
MVAIMAAVVRHSKELFRMIPLAVVKRKLATAEVKLATSE